MSWEKELVQRLLRVNPVSEKSAKYVKQPTEKQEELLVHKILLSLAKKIYEKREPVKLREIVGDMYDTVTKREMDIVRQLLKKTLIPSGIVEKLNLGKKDVRFLLAAYRFQEMQTVESSSGEKIREAIGPVIELPRECFPVPTQLLSLQVQKTSLSKVLNKLDDDLAQGKISESIYQTMRREYQTVFRNVVNQLQDQIELVTLLGLDN
ncbi:MAG: hypothetical protein IAX21_01190 [Candidatus Bathyarchaeota archaeon]|nr:hypothetical protein [Candidatus Bathyarchaeum tardum]WGM90417.1 MAG: hypothetical protein NUK63_04655 [Candidatus Bathyarchaeum tardum]WNZ29514.1 MAG: hypothetical protein IAX21_01190 [Candidatus Bathyarchaeota archaeon]